ncbi:Sec-independent protein translocase protein TatC [Candidatus Cyrtobacter comes]|uniref:Sec-independent protein translocase protein TatC n=1 Tax=Candidatus Cyrtobacter comes TaxID=675776 RepID=A0ABU5L833_9RICK|nr:twin-arginine translocase subunit TatC [Candidatus Cyrtobacter comes]MDZ5762065.1 Sec-independent protein translocase protein TatC [Candidatus Cyrtobacter comes]
MNKGSFIFHYIELRARILNCAILYFILFVICFYFAKDLYILISTPLTVTNDEIIFTDITEVFQCQVSLASYCAFLLLIPFISWEVYNFIKPALYEDELMLARLCTILSPLLFILSSVFVLEVVMPFMVKFFTSFNQSLNLQFKPKADQYLITFLKLITTFGIVFQFPIIVSILVKVRILTVKHLVEYRRHAIVVIFIIAAILTPPDIFSQIILALPLLLLYEISLFIAKLIERGC